MFREAAAICALTAVFMAGWFAVGIAYLLFL